MTGTATAAAAAVRPLPIAIEEIDRDWIEQALRTRAPDAGLRGFTIDRVDNGTCTKIRVTLDLDEAGREAGIAEKVILKGGFEPHSRAMPFMHEAEVRSYRETMPELGLHSPACYFADFDAERAQGIVIMEDLSARGATLCHPLEPHSPEAVARRLTALADYHAKTWGSAELEPGGRWGMLSRPLETGHLQSFLEPEIWQRFVDLPRGRAVSTRFQDRHWMGRALERMHTLSISNPEVVAHGDTHLGNLFVEPDGTPGFFDSLPHRWSPIAEITYHMCCALDQADRRSSERDLVAHYLEQISARGVQALGLDEAMRQYAAYLAFGYCIFLVNDAVWQPEAINTAYTARYSAAMLDNDTIGVLEAIG